MSITPIRTIVRRRLTQASEVGSLLLGDYANPREQPASCRLLLPNRMMPGGKGRADGGAAGYPRRRASVARVDAASIALAAFRILVAHFWNVR
jgi:hypothetical protein